MKLKSQACVSKQCSTLHSLCSNNVQKMKKALEQECFLKNLLSQRTMYHSIMHQKMPGSKKILRMWCQWQFQVYTQSEIILGEPPKHQTFSTFPEKAGIDNVIIYNTTMKFVWWDVVLPCFTALKEAWKTSIMNLALHVAIYYILFNMLNQEWKKKMWTYWTSDLWKWHCSKVMTSS